ncbi:MOSC domain-containing protein [uncultured Jatrophihabitans sp.]|uniref:MOSC domain-containing protein n=1 Tax=uncultured Jatrophihabitans sp. TaxID=1610747 RepID=UPI0035CA52E0
MPLTLTSLTRFPVKSCRGEALSAASIEPWGIAGDRRWMAVDADGDQLTAREHPRLLLVRPTLRPDGGLELSSAGLPDLSVDVPSDGRSTPVRVWGTQVAAASASDAAHAWFSQVIGEPARLVYFDDPTRRRPNPRFARPDDSVSFADGYPLLIATTASLRALNDLILAGPLADQGPLPMVRFRPNVVVDGSEPWAEDGWRRVRIGAATFRAVKGCDRCVMTTIDPDTAAKGKEPIATLARHRRWDGKTWFGMNLLPDTPGAVIGVGDEVEIVESVAAPDGPPR